MTKKELAKKRAQDAKRAELIAAGTLKAEDFENDDDQKPQKHSNKIKKVKGPKK